MINRFSLTNAFGLANETVARVNQICKEARRRANQEEMQEATLRNREGVSATHTPAPCDDGGSFPTPGAIPHPIQNREAQGTPHLKTSPVSPPRAAPGSTGEPGEPCPSALCGGAPRPQFRVVKGGRP